jgi:hypothetical protein
MQTNEHQNRMAATNSIYPKVAVQWLNQDLYLVDSEVFRNSHLRIAAKRW